MILPRSIKRGRRVTYGVLFRSGEKARYRRVYKRREDRNVRRLINFPDGDARRFEAEHFDDWVLW